MNKKKILVTGGAGFIGSNLINRLLSNKNNHVTCFDNLLSGSLINIKKFKNNKNFIFKNRDITKKIIGGYDMIFNLACPASPIHYQLNPITTFKTSIIGAINVLENAYVNHSTVFHASTSEVYGDPLIHPQTEDYLGNVSTIGPRACYDEGKRGAETIFFDFLRIHKTKIKVARIFNTYGPNMAINDGRVISNFVVQSLQNKPIIINGDGKQTRSFCYIDDLIDVIIKFTNKKIKFNGPINLGNTEEYTILEIANIIKKATNSKSKIVLRKKLIDDPQKRRPDLKMAKTLLKWEPKINLNKGLESTIHYFIKLLEQNGTKYHQ